MKKIISIISALLLVLLSACSNKSVAENENNNVNIITFKSNDLDGKEWTSKDLFKVNKLNLVNVWGSDCPPCIYEMPELEKLNAKLKEKGSGVIGVITDGFTHANDAKEIINMTGVTYPNVCLNEEIYNFLPIQVTPTTFFIDSEGKLIGDPIYGARDSESYMEEFDKHFALMK